MNLKMISFGENFAYPSSKTISFGSTETLLDGDVCVLDLALFPGAYGFTLSAGGIVQATGGGTNKLWLDIERRSAELTEFLESGRLLIVMAAPIPRFPAMAGKQNPFTPFPCMDFAFQSMSGENVEYVGPQEFSDFFSGILEWLQYRVVLRNFVGKPVLRIRQTNHVVGFYERSGAAMC